MTARDDFDPLAPQREAAFFYGLFLRGHDIEDLRQDIDVPRSMLDKWLKAREDELLNKDPKELGLDLYKSRGCQQCRSC